MAATVSVLLCLPSHCWKDDLHPGVSWIRGDISEPSVFSPGNRYKDPNRKYRTGQSVTNGGLTTEKTVHFARVSSFRI